MKKLFTVLLAVALALSFFLVEGSTAAHAEEAAPVWEKTYYTDVFGDPTDEWYISNIIPFSGTFKNSATDGSPLSAEILVDQDGISIVLYEYGHDRVKNALSKNESYDIRIKKANGEIITALGDLLNGSDRITIWGDDAPVIDTLLDDGIVSFYLELNSNGLTNYLFKVDCRNFGELYREQCYQIAVQYLQKDQISKAISIIKAAHLDEYKDIPALIDTANDTRNAVRYEAAMEFLKAGNFEEAIKAFKALGQYGDSADRIIEIEKLENDVYLEAEKLSDSGDIALAAMTFGKITNYKDAQKRSFALWDKIGNNTIAAGEFHTVAVKNDGSVVATGANDDGRCDVKQWRDVVALSAAFHTVGLKADGTVIAIGDNKCGQCNINDWNNIIAVAAGAYHTVGLKADGTVVAVGDNGAGQCDVTEWTDIIAIAAGSAHTVGLRADGNVVAIGHSGNGECNVSDWSDIVALAASAYNTVGLKADGTVVVVGANNYGQCNVDSWEGITSIAAGTFHTVGLTTDGSVVSAGANFYGQGKVSEWTNIIAVSANGAHTIGLKSNGTVVATIVTENKYDFGQSKVTKWTDIKLPRIK